MGITVCVLSNTPAVWNSVAGVTMFFKVRHSMRIDADFVVWGKWKYPAILLLASGETKKETSESTRRIILLAWQRDPTLRWVAQ